MDSAMAWMIMDLLHEGSLSSSLTSNGEVYVIRINIFAGFISYVLDNLTVTIGAYEDQNG